jgi:quinol monooxygenase YgiN
MPYIRISLMIPLAGREAEVIDLNDQLVAFHRGQTGCLQSYVMRSSQASQDMGRISLWESEEDAEQTASVESTLALRSRLHLLVQEGHREIAFQAD